MIAPREINIAELPYVSLQRRHELPNTEGIYFLLELDEAGDLILIYVGQSGEMRRRWKRHEVMERLSGAKDYQIAYLEMSEGDILGVESYFITEWKPPLNSAFTPIRMWGAGFYGAVPHPDILAARQRKNRPY